MDSCERVHARANGGSVRASVEPGAAERRSGTDRRRRVDPGFDSRKERRSGIDRRRGAAGSPTHGASSATLERFVFEQLPYALVVLSRTGLVLIANRAARKLLSMRTDGPARCCDLLGCRAAPGELADACVTDLVNQRGAGVVPIRTELAGQRSGERSALSVVAVATDSSRIIIQLREEEAGVAVPAAAHRAPSPTMLSISALGRTRLTTADGPLDGHWLEQRAGEVLQYLVCERHRWVLTDEIAEAIWPRPARSSVDNVRFVIYDLRRRLEPDRRHRSRSAFILSGKGRYRLDTDHVRVDADDFQQAVQDGIGAFLGGRSTVAIERLDRALELYGGDFLADAPYAAWAILERSRLHGLAAKALRLRADLARNAGDTSGLLACLERLGRMEPFDMDVQRQWLAMCLELGRYGEASRHYGDLLRRMVAEFGERPPFELSDLVQQQQQLALV